MLSSPHFGENLQEHPAPKDLSLGSRQRCSTFIIYRHSAQRYDPTTSIQEHEEQQRQEQEREASTLSRRSLSRRSTSNNMDLNESFRRMDVTEVLATLLFTLFVFKESLRDEQSRVHNAIRNNDYGNNVFT